MNKIVAALILLVSAAVPAFAESASTGVVTAVTGETAVVRRGSLIPAVPGMDIRKSDVLQAGAGSSIDVSLNSLAGCRVMADSEVLVEETKTENMRMNVASGNVLLNLRKLPKDSKFRVETPTAVASVRGTQFWGRVDSATGDAVTTFAVREGAVDVLAKNAGRTYRLQPGKALDIPRTGKQPKTREALSEEMGAMEGAETIKIS